jgi:CAAX prenyl protease-like protein
MRIAIHKHPAWPYVAPFAVYVFLLALEQHLNLPRYSYVARLGVTCATLALFSGRLLRFRISSTLPSVVWGIAVFAIWVAPDLAIPGYHQHWVFHNGLTKPAGLYLPDPSRTTTYFFLLHLAGSVVLIPVIEEIFWRGWLMRYLIHKDFLKVPLGASTPLAFCLSAVLFALEHGPYWDVGLLGGLMYNWWIVRTQSLGDCTLAHAITNACLGAYVIAAGRWEYWP